MYADDPRLGLVVRRKTCAGIGNLAALPLALGLVVGKVNMEGLERVVEEMVERGMTEACAVNEVDL